ncbi:gag-polypeptide of LTR copia-type [Phytophthora infestans]|uniref:Gag-polypeptide of LTR copia-type n=1 Tax=Phytophthora infestans TaxID=4787 RepID=A0A8S9TZX2_PHYIN|nr:gag-polypeptide of LTR copia-type [Phytophthora infestans]
MSSNTSGMMSTSGGTSTGADTSSTMVITSVLSTMTQAQSAVTSVGHPVVAQGMKLGLTGAHLGQPGLQQPVVSGIPRARPLGSSKPPKFDDSFEVYQMRRKLYLEQRDSWQVVTGEAIRPESDPVLHRHFDDRNRLVMETIIRGVKGPDAQKVCIFGTAKEMWDTLIAEKTQRDFSYTVYLKHTLCTHAYTPVQKIAGYIQEMNALHQRLQHMGPSFMVDVSAIADGRLCSSSCENVTQFDFAYRQGTPPSLQQVKNALLARDPIRWRRTLP